MIEVDADRTDTARIELNFIAKRGGMISRFDGTSIRVLLPRLNEPKKLYVDIDKIGMRNTEEFWDTVERHIHKGVHFKIDFKTFILNIRPRKSEDDTFYIHLKHTSPLPLPEIDDYVQGRVIEYMNGDNGSIDLKLSGSKKDYIIAMGNGGIILD